MLVVNGVPVNVQRKGFASVSLKYSTNDSIRACISSNEEKLLAELVFQIGFSARFWYI